MKKRNKSLYAIKEVFYSEQNESKIIRTEELERINYEIDKARILIEELVGDAESTHFTFVINESWAVGN